MYTKYSSLREFIEDYTDVLFAGYQKAMDNKLDFSCSTTTHFFEQIYSRYS
jgi:hypothetical protein